MSQPRKKGISVALILLGAALIGTFAGLTLSVLKRDPMPLVREPLSFQDATLLPPAKPAWFPPLKLKAPPSDPMAADVESLRGIRPYPGARPRRLSNNAAKGQLAMSLSWFATGDLPGEVIAFYEREFARSHLFWTAHRYSANAAYVAFIEPPLDASGTGSVIDGRLRMVSAMRQGHQTLVFLSSSFPKAMLSGHAPWPTEIALSDRDQLPSVSGATP